MFRDQQTDTNRQIANALSTYGAEYSDFLNELLGRKFLLSEPVEFHGPGLVKAQFVTEKRASGDNNAPYIYLWVEFNPGMGAFTVWGEYWHGRDPREPVYKSSPHTVSYLGDAEEVFGWLRVVTGALPKDVGARVLPAPTLDDFAQTMQFLTTPAGAIESIELSENDSGCLCAKLSVQYQVPLDYFESGTSFPGPLGGYAPFAATPDSTWWDSSYAEPLKKAVQSSLDGLYGKDAFTVSIDAEGFVLVTAVAAYPPQADEVYWSDPYPKDSNLYPSHSATQVEVPATVERVMSKEWYESKAWHNPDFKKLAGVQSLEEKSKSKYTGPVPILGQPKPSGKKPAPPGKFPYTFKQGEDKTKFDKLVAKLKKVKGVRDPKALAHWIGLRVAGSKSHEGAANESVQDRMSTLLLGPKVACEGCGARMEAGENIVAQDGKLLCEACRAELGESTMNADINTLLDRMRAVLGEGAAEVAEAKAAKKPKLGTGERFKALVKSLKKRGDVEDPAALAAWIGRKSYGPEKMAKMATAGRKRAAKARK